MRFREFLESYDKLGTGIKKGHTLEARGTKGPDKTEWAKSFKDKAELDKWVKDNDAKVFGIAYAKKIDESKGASKTVKIKSNLDFKAHDSDIELVFDENGYVWNGVDHQKGTITVSLESRDNFTKSDISKLLKLLKTEFGDHEIFFEVDKNINESELEESIGLTPWEVICNIVEKDHGEESLSDLTVSEAGKIIDLAKADKVAGKEFFDLSVGAQKKLINANPDLLKGKAASRFKKQLSEEELAEAAPNKDGIMPMSYKVGAGHKIEAYGVKGMKSTKWRKSFKDEKALEKWVDANDAEVYGTREV